MAKIFETHAHYEDKAFDADRDELIKSLPAGDIEYVVNVGSNMDTCRKIAKMVKDYDFLYGALGIHPSDIRGVTEEDLKWIEDETSANERILAIGEIGLDYYWTRETVGLQKEIFSAQLKLSRDIDLPVVVHDRDAHADTLELLKKYQPKGVVHSFSGSAEMAKEIYKLGMYIGISGVITFKNARKLPDVVKEMPLDRFLLETDAPYLAPVPFRGKTNNSSLIFYSAERIGEIKGISTEDVLKYALENTKRLYSI